MKSDFGGHIRTLRPRALLIATIVSACLAYSWQTRYPAELREFLSDPLLGSPLWLLLSCCLQFALWIALDHLDRRVLDRPLVLVLLAAVIGGFALALDARFSSGILLGLVAVILWFVLRLQASGWRTTRRSLASPSGVQAIFFLSGSSALAYQVVWQKKLIGLVGANSESVAIIVAVFMAGLGLGGLVGERLSNLGERRALLTFCGFEVAIGLFGLLSLPAFDLLANRVSAVMGGWPLTLAAASLMLPSTVLMGATLPLLVGLLRAKIPALHENLGKLYSTNAAGSAVASVLAVAALFPFMGQQAFVMTAAALNVLVALAVYFAAKIWSQAQESKDGLVEGQGVLAQTAASSDSASSAMGNRDDSSRPALSSSPGTAPVAFFYLTMIAFGCGFATIALEVTLLRQADWLTAGRAYTFGFGVGAFLAGLSWGSWRQTATPQSALRASAGLNWLRVAYTALAGPLLASYVAVLGSEAGFAVVLISLFLVGFYGARTLPMIAGLMSPANEHRLGTLLAVNIVGSVCGSLVVGFWLADLIRLQWLMIFCAMSALAVGLLLLSASDRQRVLVSRGGVVHGILLTLLVASWPTFTDQWLERMLVNKLSPNPFIFSAERRSGIVAVNQEGGRRVVYGGGVYDGAVNVGVKPDLNGISRLYRALALHDDPAEVLEIGLSSGSWAKALLLDPRVKSLSSVEINPAYVELVHRFPEVSGILSDARFSLVIDDGRRWLQANKERRFDMIVSNTTFHWRSGATLITSTEFMALVKERLKPGGILVINTTFSENVAATVHANFKHVWRIGNVLAASQAPLDDSVDAGMRRLQKHSVFRAMSEGEYKSWFQTTHALQMSQPSAHAVVLTDDRMQDEFKRW